LILSGYFPLFFFSVIGGSIFLLDYKSIY